MTLFMTAIALHLAEALFNFLVFLSEICINPCYQSTILLAIMITSKLMRVFYILLRSAQTRLGELSTSVVSGTRKKRFFSLNIFIKIITRPVTPSTSTIYVFNERCKLSNNFSLGINGLSPVFQLANMSIQFSLD